MRTIAQSLLTEEAGYTFVSYLAVTRYGLSLAEVARALSISAPTVLRGCRVGSDLLAATGQDPEHLLPPP